MGLLSWLRGDRTGGDASRSATPPSMPLADAPSPEAGKAGGSRDAWRELPPVQRVLSAPDLVTDPGGFEGSLSSRQDTTLSTAPLGHLVGPEAPSGLVHGLDTSVTGGTERTGTDPGPDPGDRVVASWPAPEGRTSPQAQPSAVPLQRAESASAPTFLSAAAAPVELPVRQLMSERPIEPSLTGAASAEPSRDRAEAGADRNGRSPSAPVGDVTGPPLQRSAAARPASTPPTRPATPGLGAPLAELPPTAQRQVAARLPGPVAETEPGSGPAPSPSDAPVNPLLGDTPTLARHGGPVQRVPEEAPEPRAPHPRRLPEHGRGHEHGHDGSTPSFAAPVPLQRLDVTHPLVPRPPQTASGPVAPLIAQRAVPLFVTGPDAPLGLPDAPGDSGAGAPAVPVRWDVPGPGAAVQRSYNAASARSSRTASPVSLTSSVSSASPVSSVAPASGSPGAAANPPLQRRTYGGPPPPRSVVPQAQRSVTGGSPSAGPSGAGPSAPRPTGTGSPFRDAGSVAVAAGVAQRMADGSVVFGGAPSALNTPSAPSAPSAPTHRTAQRATGFSEPPTPDPVPEAHPEPVPLPEPAPDPDPGAEPDAGAEFPGAASAGAGQGPPPAAPPGTPPVTDELVRALYPPLSRLLKADLRLERERAGFLINTRH
ncbi:hypothetical protein [Streptomyces sp. NPDC088258]|uniref:hypothetical protein n=1 Tax=Streptomyces sp. NPDC088258 TaxID=3365849 RepID=UPI00381E6DD9